MMRRLFLGPPVHWALLAALVALGWLAGLDRLHVTQFNLFVLALLALAAATLACVIWTSPPGRRITRDPLAPPDDNETT